MGLRSDIQTEMATALSGDLSDVNVAFTGKRVTRGAYTAATDTHVETETSYSVAQSVWSSYNVAELGASHIKPNDQKVTFSADQTTESPAIDDVLTANGANYLVVGVKPVMGGGSTPIVWVLQVREHSG